jgi:hypothetical protein
MNKIYMARKVGRSLELVLRDSCAMSITDQFWVNRSDIDMSWAKLNELRDRNETLMKVALYGETARLDYEAAKEGTTSLFTTKGTFPKFILGGDMIKIGNGAEYEWAATVIGEALGLPVQKAAIIDPSASGARSDDGTKIGNGADDALVKIALFTSPSISLVHATELHFNQGFREASGLGQHHRYFYDRLPTELMKRDFERILILNWLISNHDMHGENYGCLYDPGTFEITGVAPSFDHNSADFGGTMPELDVPEIIAPNIEHHADVVEKIKDGTLEKTLGDLKNWLSPEQKAGVRASAADIAALMPGAPAQTK